MKIEMTIMQNIYTVLNTSTKQYCRLKINVKLIKITSSSLT